MKRNVSNNLLFKFSDILIINLLVEIETAPSGMLARGVYKAVSKFVDDDEHTHLKFEWSFEIRKDWEK
jgi:hypothetical protein